MKLPWRRQLPVYSPLTPGALASGIGAALAGSASARRRVEAWLVERYQPRDLLLTDSGTSALALALRAAASRAGTGRVLMPAYGCYDLVTAAMAGRVDVAWYDVDPRTLQPDWPSVEAGIAGQVPVAAVVLVHHYGIPADLARLRSLLAGNSPAAFLIEDAAQAVGGSLGGRALGAHGDLSILSFGRGKGMTGGGGGALLAGSDAGAEVLASLHDRRLKGGSGVRGWVSTAGQWVLARPLLYALPASLPFLRLGDTVFRAPHEPGPMANAALGVLASTLGLVDPESQARRANATRLVAAAGDRVIPVLPTGQAGYLRFPFLGPGRDAVTDQSRLARLGIMPGYPIPLPVLPGSPFQDVAPPGATELVSRLWTLPVHSRLSGADSDRVDEVLRRWR